MTQLLISMEMFTLPSIPLYQRWFEISPLDVSLYGGKLVARPGDDFRSSRLFG